jgi:hypothetical protein
MRVEQLSAGTLVNGKRVTGKTAGWDNGRRTITVTYGTPAPGERPDQVTYYVGQNVPGSPRRTPTFLAAADTRLRHDGHRGLRPQHDRDETWTERLERRTALRLALAAA